MIVNSGTPYQAEYRNDEGRMEATHWGKYDSAFHAWLVECCDPDDYAGEPDYGGAQLYGKRVDYWTSSGFHSLVTFNTEQEAREDYAAFVEQYDTDTHECEYPCWVCGKNDHCGCACSLCDVCDDYHAADDRHEQGQQ